MTVWISSRSDHGHSATDARRAITKSGKPAAVLLSAQVFDDMLEELDPEFQKSLRVAAAEHKAGKSITVPARAGDYDLIPSR